MGTSTNIRENDKGVKQRGVGGRREEERKRRTEGDDGGGVEHTKTEKENRGSRHMPSCAHLSLPYGKSILVW